MPRGILESVCHPHEGGEELHSTSFLSSGRPRGFSSTIQGDETLLISPVLRSRAFHTSMADFLGGKPVEAANSHASAPEDLVAVPAKQLDALIRKVQAAEAASRSSEIDDYLSAEVRSEQPVLVHQHHHRQLAVGGPSGDQEVEPARPIDPPHGTRVVIKIPAEEEAAVASQQIPEEAEEPASLDATVLLGAGLAIFAQVFLWGHVFVTLFKPNRPSSSAQGPPPTMAQEAAAAPRSAPTSSPTGRRLD